MVVRAFVECPECLRVRRNDAHANAVRVLRAATSRGRGVRTWRCGSWELQCARFIFGLGASWSFEDLFRDGIDVLRSSNRPSARDAARIILRGLLCTEGGE